MEKENLTKIISNLKEVRTDTKTKVSDEVLWESGIKIAISEQIQIHRRGGKLYPQETAFSSFHNKPFDSPATPNQIWVLKNRLDFKEDASKLTREEASHLIDKLKEGKK